MRKICFLAGLFLLACIPDAVAQTTVTITADKDNTIYSESGNTSNGAGQNIFAGATGGGNVRRALIRFDLSSIPSGATVTAVTVTLNCNRLAASAAGVRLHRLTADWGEGTSDASSNEGAGAPATTNDATWTNRFHPSTSWASPGGDFNGTASITQGSVALGTVNLTGGSLVADVQSFVTNAATNFGWAVLGSSESTMSTALRFASSENPATASRPQISVTYNVVTPVKLAEFFAVRKSQQVVLRWKTASEQQNDFFEIEYSKNGFEFSAIGQVKGAGNSNQVNEYSFIHQAGEGKHYYRLAQHDFDGKVNYSGVVSVTSSAGTELRLSPNPAGAFLKPESNSNLEGARFEVISVAGSRMISGLLTREIRVEGLAPGVYQLRVVTTSGELLKSIFIKN